MTNSKPAKIPPQNLEAEQSVLGALLLDKESIIKVADFIQPDDFYVPAHSKIYECILELYEKSQPLDIISLTNILKEKNLLKDVGGSAYVSELVNQVPTASHVMSYAKIIREKRILRDLIHASSYIATEAFSPEKEVEELLDDVERKILSVSQISVQKVFTHLKEELRLAYERIEKLHQGQGALRGVTSGFDELDNLLSGFQRSDLIILGARPSLGKTSLALDIARGAAMKGGVSVGIFSLEMSREQVVDRLISAESQVSLWKLRTGRITDDLEFEMIQRALDRLSKTHIYIDDTASPNIMSMRSMARRLQVEHGLDLLVVDYLQLIAPRANMDSMVQQITEVSRGLKGLARELNIPILALSQLSRAIDQRDHKIPRLSDLRESGSIEQDADVVMFIYRKDRDKEDVAIEEQNLAQIIIAKHRNGPLGTIQLKFDPERASFRPVETKYESAEF